MTCTKHCYDSHHVGENYTLLFIIQSYLTWPEQANGKNINLFSSSLRGSSSWLVKFHFYYHFFALVRCCLAGLRLVPWPKIKRKKKFQFLKKITEVTKNLPILVHLHHKVWQWWSFFKLPIFQLIKNLDKSFPMYVVNKSNDWTSLKYNRNMAAILYFQRVSCAAFRWWSSHSEKEKWNPCAFGWTMHLPLQVQPHMCPEYW